MSSQFFSSRHKTCVSGSKIQSGPAQLGLGGGKDDRIRTGIQDKDTRLRELGLPGSVEITKTAGFWEDQAP